MFAQGPGRERRSDDGHAVAKTEMMMAMDRFEGRCWLDFQAEFDGDAQVVRMPANPFGGWLRRTMQV